MKRFMIFVLCFAFANACGTKEFETELLSGMFQLQCGFCPANSEARYVVCMDGNDVIESKCWSSDTAQVPITDFERRVASTSDVTVTAWQDVW